MKDQIVSINPALTSSFLGALGSIPSTTGSLLYRTLVGSVESGILRAANGDVWPSKVTHYRHSELG